MRHHEAAPGRRWTLGGRLAWAAAGLLALAALSSCGPVEQRPADPIAGTVRWFKGDTHVHSRWSDGRDFPEVVAQWYKDHGYNFLVVTDHNTLQEGAKWVEVVGKEPTERLAEYRERWGDDWVETRQQKARKTGKKVLAARAKALAEYRDRLEEGGRFILIPGEEINRRLGKVEVHTNAINVTRRIAPRVMSGIPETIAHDLAEVRRQGGPGGRPVMSTFNHPNWGGVVPVEAFSAVPGIEFFEIINNNPAEDYNRPGRKWLGTDFLWDVALTRRLAQLGFDPIYAVAADDSHSLREDSGTSWIMVRADALTEKSLMAAMRAGDFYATSGVRLKDVRRDGDDIVVEIDAEQGVTYRTQFIGTRLGYDRSSENARDLMGNLLPAPERYSPEIGEVLAEMEGPSARYTPAGDEYYVRARVISSKEVRLRKEDLEKGVEPALQTAWTQPVVISQAGR